MTGAIEHYRATLKLEPGYPGGINQLRIPSCYIKYHQSPPPGEQDCPRQQQGHEARCGASQQDRARGYSGAEEQMRKQQQNTITNIQVRIENI